MMVRTKFDIAESPDHGQLRITRAACGNQPDLPCNASIEQLKAVHGKTHPAETGKKA